MPVCGPVAGPFGTSMYKVPNSPQSKWGSWSLSGGEARILGSHLFLTYGIVRLPPLPLQPWGRRADLKAEGTGAASLPSRHVPLTLSPRSAGRATPATLSSPLLCSGPGPKTGRFPLCPSWFRRGARHVPHALARVGPQALPNPHPPVLAHPLGAYRPQKTKEGKTASAPCPGFSGEEDGAVARGTRRKV